MQGLIDFPEISCRAMQADAAFSVSDTAPSERKRESDRGQMKEFAAAKVHECAPNTLICNALQMPSRILAVSAALCDYFRRHT